MGIRHLLNTFPVFTKNIFDNFIENNYCKNWQNSLQRFFDKLHLCRVLSSLKKKKLVLMWWVEQGFSDGYLFSPYQTLLKKLYLGLDIWPRLVHTHTHTGMNLTGVTISYFKCHQDECLKNYVTTEWLKLFRKSGYWIYYLQ